MAETRARRARRSHCPVCDARIDDTLAMADAPTCPKCEAALWPVRVVGIWRRLGAFAIDFGALACTIGLLNWALLAIVDPPPLLGDARGTLPRLLALLDLSIWAVVLRIAPGLVMAALYFGAFWTLTGQTLGQRVLKIRVIDPYGRPPGLVRTAVRLVGQAIALAPAALGWIWLAFDREKRGWHDHLARTYVVRDT
jgi:uncharacterized RDD family membrane protein YckC